MQRFEHNVCWGVGACRKLTPLFFESPLLSEQGGVWEQGSGCGGVTVTVVTSKLRVLYRWVECSLEQSGPRTGRSSALELDNEGGCKIHSPGV